jgi:hypothetical protein
MSIKPHHVLAYFGLLVFMLVVALVGSRIVDESQRVDFMLGVPVLTAVVFFLIRYVVFRRRR